MVISLGTNPRSEIGIRLSAKELYFPVIRRMPYTPYSWGVQIADGRANLSRWVIPERIYQQAARWVDIEAQKGVYKLPAWMIEDAEVIAPNPLILGAKTCPAWARLWGSELGSPPKRSCWGDYARFVCYLIREFSPWGIELWNEPDVPTGHPEQYWYGAW